MAKAKPAFTLVDMEDDMGYKVGASSRLDDTERRFYSDLKPVPDGAYGLAEKDYHELSKGSTTKIAAKSLPGFFRASARAR